MISKELFLILLYLTISTCTNLTSVKIDRFCHSIQYYNINDSINTTTCKLIDYYKLEEIDQNSCVFVDHLKNYITLEMIASKCKQFNVQLIFIYKNIDTIGYWQFKWTGQEEVCIPIYEINDIENITIYENQTIFLNTHSNNRTNHIYINQVINPWIQFLYIDNNVILFYILGFLAHGTAFIYTSYYIYYIFFIFKDFPFIDKLVIILSNIGNFMRVLYMILDPMNVNHILSEFGSAIFATMSLPWTVMTWLFMAIKYDEIFFVHLMKDTDEIIRLLNKRFIQVLIIISIMLVPQFIFTISMTIYNYDFQLIMYFANNILYIIIIVSICTYFVVTMIKFINLGIKTNKYKPKKQKGIKLKKYIYKTILVFIGAILMIICIILGILPIISNYPFQRFYIWAIGYAFVLAFCQMSQVNLFNFKIKHDQSSSTRTNIVK